MAVFYMKKDIFKAQKQPGVLVAALWLREDLTKPPRRKELSAAQPQPKLYDIHRFWETTEFSPRRAEITNPVDWENKALEAAQWQYLGA